MEKNLDPQTWPAMTYELVSIWALIIDEIFKNFLGYFWGNFYGPWKMVRKVKLAPDLVESCANAEDIWISSYSSVQANFGVILGFLLDRI